MAETCAASEEEIFRGAVANLRDTAKWLVGGVVTTAVAVLIGSPLTNLGALDLGWRLFAAIIGAFVAYMLLGYLLWNALRVVVAGSITMAELADAEAAGGSEAAVAKRVAERVKARMPCRLTTFRGILARNRELRDAADTSDEADAAYEAFADALSALKAQIGFEHKLARFDGLRLRLFVLMPFVIAGVGVFAWAANPPPETRVLSDRPQRTSFLLSPDEALALAPAIMPACYRPTLSGGLAGEAIVLYQLEGRTEIVTLPPGNCQPVRLTRQDGRWFMAD